MLKRVTVRNWRAFEAVEIALQPGLNVLVGPNGVGKTSLLEAVAFALAGELCTLDDARLMVRAESQPTDVTVAFALRGTDWEVSRGLGGARGRVRSLLRRGDVVVAEGSGPVAAALEHAFGVPTAFFLRILYMPEGEVYRFLTDPPLAALDAHLRRLLGLEQLARLEQAAAQVKREIARERTQLVALAEQVARNAPLLAAGRTRWGDDPAARRHALEAERDRLATAQTAATAARRRLEDEGHRLQRTLAELQALEQERAALQAAGDPEAELPALRAHYAQLQVDLQRLDTTLAETTAQRRALVEQTRALAARPPRDLLAEDATARERSHQLAAAIQEADRLLAGVAAQRKALAESTQLLQAHAPGQAAEPVCPVCRQPLPEALRQRLLAENAAQDTALAEQETALRAQRQAFLADLDTLAQACRERLLAERAAQDRALAERLTALQTQRQNLAAALREAETREGELVAQRRRREDLERRWRELLPDGATREDLQRQHDQLAAQVAQARAQEAELAQRATAVQEELAALQGYLQLATMAGRSPAALARQHAALTRRELLAELFATATTQTLAQLRAGALAQAYEAVGHAWEQFSGWTEVQLEPQPKGQLAVRRGGRRFELAQLSGGERAAFLVLLHAHLARQFGPGGFLLLDEPLEHLDAANGRRLLQHLARACADGLLPQVVVATVEAELVRAALEPGAAQLLVLDAAAA
ncbi:MAG TPA: AAA family ATPase [Chloroflexota bacterium]|nr:AAA family ATPase [Chloroflexota bacterium]